MKRLDHILAKSFRNGGTTLVDHLYHVSELCQITAAYLGMDTSIAKKGGILHDIGKVSPQFQQTLQKDFKKNPGFLFRHEIASLFFISLLDEAEQPPVIDMVVAHHKSIYEGKEGSTGILDLKQQDTGFINKHLEGFEKWSSDALAILHHFGFKSRKITKEEARKNIQDIIKYCELKTKGYSIWKGILNGSDYLASSIEESGQRIPSRLFIKPNLTFYHSRTSELYPLSLIGTDHLARHENSRYSLKTSRL